MWDLMLPWILFSLDKTIEKLCPDDFIYSDINEFVL